ncbi:hypothetical protein [Enterovirga rhinocerotis]|uniref:Uncharacterized protein n=1 Tax=Enterovirga rhinocerotis TaxID=1339210 RepID=A0A4R7BRD2_9HYPH|nr:hypothetical protein [Enterovirga rhinocerotis]TDR88240.1 hypothetical protein EV668_4112 [Enterovirga rhinocerotis]
MPPDGETASLALEPASGYSPRAALADLVDGAFRARRLPRRRGSEPLGWGWQAAMVALAGFVSGIDVYVREPFRASDLPPGAEGWLPLLNVVGNPAIAILVSLAVWLLMIGGGRVISFGRYDARRLGSGLAFGWWAATLPILGAIALGMAVGFASDTIAIVVAFLVTAHMIPSVAEACDLSIAQAFGVTILGPLALILLVVLGLLAFGFSAKLLGMRP